MTTVPGHLFRSNIVAVQLCNLFKQTKPQDRVSIVVMPWMFIYERLFLGAYFWVLIWSYRDAVHRPYLRPHRQDAECTNAYRYTTAFPQLGRHRAAVTQRTEKRAHA